MSFWIAAGMMTAVVLSLVISPLGKSHKALMIVLTLAVPLLAIGMYLFAGNPQFTP